MKNILIAAFFLLILCLPGYSLSNLELGEMKDGKWAEIKQSNFNPAWAYLCPLDFHFRENNTTVFKGVRRGWWLDFSQLAVEKELSERLSQNKRSASYLREYQNKIYYANILNWIAGAGALYGVLSYDYKGGVLNDRDANVKNQQIMSIYLGSFFLGLIVAPMYGGSAFDDLFKAVDVYNNPVP